MWYDVKVGEYKNRGRCICCGGAVYGDPACAFQDEKKTFALLCGMCSVRDRLCMHNVFERVAGGGEAIMHSSRPHRDASGARDPRTCQWCLAKEEDAEFLERRRSGRV